MKNIDKQYAQAAVEADEVCKQALTTVDGIESIELSSYEEVQNTLPIIAELREKREAIDGVRKKWTAGLKEVIDDINAQFKPGIEAYKSAENHLKKAIARHTQNQLDKRDKLLSQVKTAAPSKRKTLIKSTENLAPPKMAGLSIRETWKGKITNAAELLVWIIANERFELLNIDEKALTQLTKAAKADPEIPGWTAWQESTAVVTPSKIR